MSHHHASSPFPSCFRPSSDTDIHHLPPPTAPPNSGNANLTTCLYQTDLGLFSLTWSSSFLGHTLHHSTMTTTPATALLAKFGSGPEPQSRFYIAVVVEREMVLVVGDLTKEAFAKTKALKQERPQVLVLRREHVFGNRVYTTRARFGGKDRVISIDCSMNKDAVLSFSVDNKKVLQISGNLEEMRGLKLMVFESNLDLKDEEAVVRKQEQSEACGGGCGRPHQQEEINEKNNNSNAVLWQQNSSCSNTSLGMSPVEWRKMRKSLMRTAARSSSSSSISMSSASSGCSSSVMEWASSSEESELCGGPIGFSLLSR
uniref:Uncharacterized protein n=1 Tax=Salix viminalis TaxID=40686 RepID=A0A6N2KHI9_SALVM